MRSWPRRRARATGGSPRDWGVRRRRSGGGCAPPRAVPRRCLPLRCGGRGRWTRRWSPRGPLARRWRTAVDALGTAARACRLWLGIRAGPWELAVGLTGGLLWGPATRPAAGTLTATGLAAIKWHGCRALKSGRQTRETSAGAVAVRSRQLGLSGPWINPLPLPSGEPFPQFSQPGPSRLLALDKPQPPR